MRLLLLTAVLSLSAMVAHAQRIDQDYLVTAAGDTLRGRILSSDKGPGHITLKRAKMPSKRFVASEIQSYGDQNGVLGKTLPVSPQQIPQLMRPLVTGPVSLYSGRGTDGKKGYFLQSLDSTYLVQIAAPTAQLTLHRFLPSCPTLEFGTTKVQQRYPINSVGLTRLTMEYNKCRHPQEPSNVQKYSDGIRLAYGIKAGMNVSDFQLASEPYSGERENQVGYQAGVFLRGYGKSRFSLVVEAMYQTLRGRYNQSVPNPYTGVRREVTINYHQLQIPVLLRYSLGSGSVRPYVNAGPVYGPTFRNTSVETQYTTRTGAVRHYPIDTVDGRSFGWSAGVGTTVTTKNWPEVSLEARYEQMHYGNYAFFTPTRTSFRFDAGICF